MEGKTSLLGKIRQAMSAEKAHRYPGVRDGLSGHESLAPFTACKLAADGSVAVVAPRRAVVPRGPAAYRRAAEVEIWGYLGRGGSSLDRGFVVAGGAPASLLMGRPVDNDIDLFLVGLDAGRARALVRAFGGALRERLHHPDLRLQVYRTVRCVTFAVGHADGRVYAKIQIILRLYGSVSEVLHGFDLGASKVADDGERLYFTAEGRLAYELGLNVVNPDVRRASYEGRLRKYWLRGFGLALPDLGACPGLQEGGAVLDLPFLEVRADSFSPELRLFQGATLRVGRARASRVACQLDPARCPVTRQLIDRDALGAGVEYEDLDHTSYHSTNPRDLAVRNMQAARHGRVEALCAAASFSTDLDVTAIQPSIESFVEAAWDAPLQYSMPWKALTDNTWALIGMLRHVAPLPGQQRRAFVRLLARPFAKAHEIPFALTRLEETSFELSAVNGRVPPSDWYGRHYARASPALVQLREYLADLLRVRELADVALSFVEQFTAETCCGCGMGGAILGGGDGALWCLLCGEAHRAGSAAAWLPLPSGWKIGEPPSDDAVDRRPFGPFRVLPDSEDESDGDNSDEPLGLRELFDDPGEC